MKIKCLMIIIILLIPTLLNSNVFANVIKSDLRNPIEKSSSNEYDMVIISTEQFADSLIPLIEHKNSHGLQTFYKDVEEIYDEYQGRDKPEKIKYFIKNTIETKGISYVFLVGGIDLVPIRRTHSFWQNAPTDLYYSDIYNSTGEFCSWDYNNNNIFGEEKIDKLDLYEDVFIGRIPCINNDELNVIVDKIINYENSAFGSDWFKNILLLGGDTFPEVEGLEGEINCDIVGKEMEKHGFKSNRLYISKRTFLPILINYYTTKGAGFLTYSGHGNVNCIGTHFHKISGFGIRYLNLHLNGMKNGHKLPIVFLEACLTGILDLTTYKYSNLAKLFNLPTKAGFAYNMVKKEGGGAIAAIGATREAGGGVPEDEYPAPDYLNIHFFMHYEEGTTVAEMLTKSKHDYIDNGLHRQSVLENVQNFNLIGDPSLKVGGYP